MVILAGGIVIDCRFIFEKEFKSLEKYQVDLPFEFLLCSLKNLPDFQYKKKTTETVYYDLYDTDLGTLQVQKNIGAILYQDKKIYIYPIANNFNAEYILSQYEFVYWIRHYTKSIFIHSSSVNYNNKGILFCAKSGTGKSTQRRLWSKFGATCINDDKNVISLIDDKLYIMPNPWSGKHFCDSNLKTELKAIVFLHQNKDNEVLEISLKQRLSLLLKQIQLPSNDYKHDWNIIVDKMLNLCCISYGCNMEDDAFYTLKDYLEGSI